MGVGKSWLARHIQRKIDDAESASTIWLDTFEADWDDDPSLSIIAELVNQTSEEDKTGLRKKFALTLSHVVSTVAKVLTKSAGMLSWTWHTDWVLDPSPHGTCINRKQPGRFSL